MRLRSSFATGLLLASAVTAAGAEERRALVVGIDRYVTSEAQPNPRGLTNLEGAVNDARAMAAWLGRVGFTALDLRIRPQETTASALSQALDDLTRGLSAGDEVVFYFSGHGSQRRNSGSPETDRRDETLVASDAISGTADLRDKELRRRFNRALAAGARVTIILDSCHSGSGARGDPWAERGRVALPQAGDLADHSDHGPTLESQNGALVLAAARSFEEAREAPVAEAVEVDRSGQVHGAFTLALLQSVGALPAAATAGELFLGIRARLSAWGLSQEPVLGGSAARKQRPIFASGDAPRRDGSVAVRASAGRRVELQGGWVDGLSVGSLLRRPGDDRNALRVDAVGATASEATWLLDGEPPPAPGNLFQLRHWAVPAEADLEVCLPTTPLGTDALRAEAARARAWIETAGLSVHDQPTAAAPLFGGTLFFDQGRWRLRNSRGSTVDVGETLAGDTAPARLLEVLSGLDPPRVLLSLPAPQALAAALEIGDGRRYPDIKVVGCEQATYRLTARLTGGDLAFAWIHRDARIYALSARPMPIASGWRAVTADPDDLRFGLESDVLLLARVRAWLALSSPPDHFPYRLALRLVDDSLLEETDAPDASIVIGQEFGLSLIAPAAAIEVAAPIRHVYVSVLDQWGHMKLLYPRAEEGSDENRWPRGVQLPRIDLPGSDSVAIEPAGIDSYFLITTEEPLPDPLVLEWSGYRGPDPSGKTPLDHLLRNLGTGQRGDTPKPFAPSSWSIQRLAVAVVPEG